MVTFFLDTDICIYTLKGRFPAIAARLAVEAPEAIKIASIVKAELSLGALKGSATRRRQIARFLAPFDVVSFDDRATQTYATFRHDLEARGAVIGPNDLILAATVAARGGTLVTHNTREFTRIPSLAVEDWTQLELPDARST